MLFLNPILCEIIFLENRSRIAQMKYLCCLNSNSVISEADVQSYILKLHESGRLDGNGGVGVKTIHDIILVFRLAMEYAYKARIIPLLNWLLIEYLKPDSLHHVSALSHDQERELI